MQGLPSKASIGKPDRQSARSRPWAAMAAGYLVLAGVLSTTRWADARPEYPGRVQERLDLGSCVPTCMLCHSDPAGGADNLNRFSGFGLLIAEREELPDLTGDLDGDGASDGDELRRGESPVIAGNASICSPQYGCGARIARPSPEGSTRAGTVLLLGMAIGALIRRTTRRSRRLRDREG